MLMCSFVCLVTTHSKPCSCNSGMIYLCFTITEIGSIWFCILSFYSFELGVCGWWDSPSHYGLCTSVPIYHSHSHSLCTSVPIHHSLPHCSLCTSVPIHLSLPHCSLCTSVPIHHSPPHCNLCTSVPVHHSPSYSMYTHQCTGPLDSPSHCSLCTSGILTVKCE